MSKPLSSLTDKALVREYQRIHAKIDKALTKLVEQGLGDVKPSDMMRGRDTTYASDKTVREYLALTNYAAEIRYHAETRYGPGLIIVNQLCWKNR
jgi:hypothetical protein